MPTKYFFGLVVLVLWLFSFFGFVLPLLFSLKNDMAVLLGVLLVVVHLFLLNFIVKKFNSKGVKNEI